MTSTLRHTHHNITASHLPFTNQGRPRLLKHILKPKAKKDFQRSRATLSYYWRIHPPCGAFNLCVTVTDGKQTVAYRMTWWLPRIGAQLCHNHSTTVDTRRLTAAWHGAVTAESHARQAPSETHAPRLTARVVSLRRDSRRRRTRRHALWVGMWYALLLRRIITALLRCYRCFDHHSSWHSISLDSGTLCHDCAMIVPWLWHDCAPIIAANAWQSSSNLRHSGTAVTQRGWINLNAPSRQIKIMQFNNHWSMGSIWNLFWDVIEVNNWTASLYFTVLKHRTQENVSLHKIRNDTL